MMEKVLENEGINNGKVRHEASQKAMKALVGLTALLCVAVVGGVVMFSILLQRL